jgi:hypothetical protein
MLIERPVIEVVVSLLPGRHYIDYGQVNSFIEFSTISVVNFEEIAIDTRIWHGVAFIA